MLYQAYLAQYQKRIVVRVGCPVIAYENPQSMHLALQAKQSVHDALSHQR